MKIIRKSYDSINKILSFQQFDRNKKYKWLVYLYVIKENNEYIIYNLWTGQIIVLTEDEYLLPNQNIQKILINNWYKIPVETDDYSLYYLFMQKLQNQYPRKRFNKIKLCTLLTTTGCNAQCYYCYEKGMKVEFMTKEVVDNLINFFLKDKVEQPLNLKWFGGEPLLNIEIINYMCQQLKKNNISYYSTFLSNGYLIKNLSKQDLQKWNVKSFQITIDGYQETYNKIKNYKNKDDINPFSTIINNIDFLLQNKIQTRIRMNLDYNNVEEQKKVVDFLKSKFSNSSYFSLYSSPIYDLINFNSMNNNKEDRKKIFENYKEIIQYIGERAVLPRRIQRTHCMADDGTSIVVAPNGFIGTCEHHPYDGYYTQNINKIPYNLNQINKWAEKTPFKEQCKTCFYKPQCYTLKECQIDIWCDEYSIDFMKFKIERALRQFYKSYKENIK